MSIIKSVWHSIKDFGKESVQEVVEREAKQLDLQILNDQLEQIDTQHRINANQAKAIHLSNWLQRDVPRSIR